MSFSVDSTLLPSMKFFIVALLVAVCQAELFGQEKAAFKFLSSISIDKIVETVEEEMNKLIHRELSTEEGRVIHELAQDFAESIRDEASQAIAEVEKKGELSREFIERMFNHLKMSAAEIARGLEMTPGMLQQFVENMLKDIAEFEAKGIFHLDIEKTFHGIVERAIAMVHHKFSTRRDLTDILSKVNDTILKIIGHLHGKYHDLGKFFRDTLKNVVDKIKPHIENVKVLAKDFIDHISAVKESVIRQAIEFFRPFASKLGSLWKELLQKAHERLSKLSNVTPASF